MKSILCVSLIVFIAVILFSVYASSIHNQYFSAVASLDRNIEVGERCAEVYSMLEEYQLRNPIDVFVKRSDISNASGWEHRVDTASIILLNDLSTPFDTISYYVFCSDSDLVLDTFLVGD